MTVRDLVAELQNCPPDAIVVGADLARIMAAVADRVHVAARSTGPLLEHGLRGCQGCADGLSLLPAVVLLSRPPAQPGAAGEAVP